MTGYVTHGLSEIKTVANGRRQLVCSCGTWRSHVFWGHSKKAHLVNVEELRQHVISTWRQSES